VAHPVGSRSEKKAIVRTEPPRGSLARRGLLLRAYAGINAPPLARAPLLVTLRPMSTERKPSDDLREGLGLLFRAAAGVAQRGLHEVAKDVDLVKAVRAVGTMAEYAGKEIARMATLFEQTFEREMRGEKEPVQEAEGKAPAEQADVSAMHEEKQEAKTQETEKKPRASEANGQKADTPVDLTA